MTDPAPPSADPSTTAVAAGGRTRWLAASPKGPKSPDLAARTFRVALFATVAVALVSALAGIGPSLLVALATQAVLIGLAWLVNDRHRVEAAGGATEAGQPGALARLGSWGAASSLLAIGGFVALPWWPGVAAELPALGLATLMGPVSAVVVAAAVLPSEATVGVSVVALASALLLGLAGPLPTGIGLTFSVAAAGLCLTFVGVHGAVTWEIGRLRRIAARQDSLLDELQLAAEGAHVGLWHWNLAEGVVHLSSTAEGILGLSKKGAHLGADWLTRVEPADAGRLRLELETLIEHPAPPIEVRFRVRTGPDEERWALLRAAAARDGARAVRLAGSITDVTTWTRNEARLRETAYHDPLTRLPNRALMMDQLAHLFARARSEPDQLFAVLFLDLDGFKLINDSLGHRVGDALLVEIARRLERAVRPCDTVARLGGDEFVMLLENLATTEEALQIASRVLSRLRPVFHIAGQELMTNASIGIAMGPGPYGGPEEIIRDADTAMYRAKAEGKGRCRVFDHQMRELVVARLNLERELQAAVDQGEFRLAYQPIVELQTGRIMGVEALLRWPRGNRPPLGPADFVPVAEENGLIVPISWWVIETAAAAVAAWRANLPDAPQVWVQVNVCADVLILPELPATVLRILERHGLAADALRFEITESAMLDPGGGVRGVLAELRGAGFQVHLDDFGTGYSSLSYLYRYPVDGLKIDRAFVRELQGPERPGLVAPILQIAQSLGLSVTAEGIETSAQLDALVALGCPNGQGFYFAPGVSDVEIGRLLGLPPERALGAGRTLPTTAEPLARATVEAPREGA